MENPTGNATFYSLIVNLSVCARARYNLTSLLRCFPRRTGVAVSPEGDLDFCAMGCGREGRFNGTGCAKLLNFLFLSLLFLAPLVVVAGLKVGNNRARERDSADYRCKQRL